jgi:hypothetical protein
MGRRRRQSHLDRTGRPKLQHLVLALQREGLLDRVQTSMAVAAAVPGMTRLEINPRHPADHELSRDGTGLPVTAVIRTCLVSTNSNLIELLMDEFMRCQGSLFTGLTARYVRPFVCGFVPSLEENMNPTSFQCENRPCPS